MRCIKHNFEFSQTASNHLKGARCKKCGIESRIKKQTGNIDELKKKWNKTHKNKYCYDHVKYVNNRVKIEIECSIHGNFWQNPSNHDRGAGCAKCASKQSADNRRKSLEDFIKEANEKHNNKYDYSKVEMIIVRLNIKKILTRFVSYVPLKTMVNFGKPHYLILVKVVVVPNVGSKTLL